MKEKHRPHIQNDRIEWMRIQRQYTDRMNHFVMLPMEKIEHRLMQESMKRIEPEIACQNIYTSMGQFSQG